MIKFIGYTREAEKNVRSSGDMRTRVDAYFCEYVDAALPGESWVCRFEVAPGTKFVPQSWPTKADALAARGYTI